MVEVSRNEDYGKQVKVKYGQNTFMVIVEWQQKDNKNWKWRNFLEEQ